MSNEHDNDDEIRESIPCVSFWAHEHGEGVALCLPVGYSLDSEGGVFCRGQRVSVDGGERRAWDDAVAREKERRQRAGQPSAADKATAMLSEVIRERDALRAALETERSARRATDMWALYRERDGLRADLARADQEREYLRAKLDRVRAIADRHDLIYASTIDAIVGEDGEA